MTMSRSNSANTSNRYFLRSHTTTNAAGTDTYSNLANSETTALLSTYKNGSQPGFAFEHSLSRDLQISSKSARLASGFKYPSVLSPYGILEGDWSRFTHEITESSKLSPSQWRAVIGVGAGTMAIGGMILGILGVIPAVLAARQKRVNQEIRNFTKAMSSAQLSFSYRSQEDLWKGREIEENEKLLPHRINQWNEAFFNPRGIMIRVDMPYDLPMVEHDSDVARRQDSHFPEPSIFKEQECSQTEKYKANQRV